MFKVQRLNLPPYNISIRQHGGRDQIFDVLRRKFVALTPEEWVRQHFIHFLADHKGYPASLLANEVQLRVGDKTVRADSVLYDTSLRPLMIIEYKAPSIALTQKRFRPDFGLQSPAPRRLSRRQQRARDLLL